MRISLLFKVFREVSEQFAELPQVPLSGKYTAASDLQQLLA
jgi:hypothetical protein